MKTTAGFPGSFDELVIRYHKRLLGYLNTRIKAREDTEEIVQETFIKAYQNIQRFDPEQKFSTWLYTIATRLMYSYYRKKKTNIRDYYFEDSILDPDEEICKEQDLKNIWKRAKKLPAFQFKALWLRYIEDLSLKEIAVI